MTFTQVIGAAATTASVISFTPQAYKIIKTRDTSSISVNMYIVTVIGFGLWLTYGISLRSWPLMITNGLCLCLSAFILAMTVFPQRLKNKVADEIEEAGEALTRV